MSGSSLASGHARRKSSQSSSHSDDLRIRFQTYRASFGEPSLRQLPSPSSGGRRSQRTSPLHSSKLALPPVEDDSDDPPAPQGPLTEYLSRKRPSLAPSDVIEDSDDSPADGPDNLRKSLQIDMKGLVGDALGNMSISPSTRDIVLAARRGLFIIDLESPLEVPRFLPQGGTWQVADVQWNPHPARAEYVISTSSEKLLVWNLNHPVSTSPTQAQSSDSAIHHILHAHYRAITDINWHTSECDVVCSTGIDSWIWAWDLRTPERPIFGLSAFNSAGTHVKWSRTDANLLASTHGHEVVIWDRRKGSLPINRIQAHESRIYGLDWSPHKGNEIITCSLDKSIKVWDTTKKCVDLKNDWINEVSIRQPDISVGSHHCKPLTNIRTNYPMWRARYLPFGRGVLSLPQRGETAVELFSLDVPSPEQKLDPVMAFQGHSDVVKEFVWRRGNDYSSYQLITWSKDRTLRFWPIEDEVMEKVGCNLSEHREKTSEIKVSSLEPHFQDFSFRNPPAPQEASSTLTEPSILAALSAPIGHRAILAEVRAGAPPQRQPHSRPKHPLLQLPNVEGTSFSPNAESINRPDIEHISSSLATGGLSASLLHRRGTMSRGNATGRPLTQMDPFTWLSSVRVGEHGNKSDSGSRDRSRDTRSLDRDSPDVRRSSGSRTRDGGEERDNQQSLQDEITSVLTKLSGYKIKLEKHDLTKKRTCTLGLHGPWGEFSAVFIRVTFTFPKDYPMGVPTCDVERNPLIANKDRAFMLRRLKAIRERRRPCLEPCLRFLLFANEDEEPSTGGLPLDEDESSSDEDDTTRRKAREITVALLRNNKNLAEPRTTQGTFGPNGELVCFFRAPPRIVRPVLRNLTESPASREELSTSRTSPKKIQQPAVLSDAIRMLGMSRTDRSAVSKSSSTRQSTAQESTLLTTMSNLLTYTSEPARSKDFVSRDSPDNEDGNNTDFAFAANRRSTVYITNTMGITGPDKTVAVDYIFQHSSLSQLCETNASLARLHGRIDHERIFIVMAAVVAHGAQRSTTSARVLATVVRSLYSELSRDHDVQMLAMLSSVLLQSVHTSASPAIPASMVAKATTLQKKSSKPLASSPDYFNFIRPRTANAPTPPWSTSPSSPPGPANPLSTSNSSRGSWSSLFNAAPMRQFMSGVQDLADGLVTPSEILSAFPDASGISIPVPGRPTRGPGSPGLRLAQRRTSSFSSPPPQPVSVSRSWQESSIKLARAPSSKQVTVKEPTTAIKHRPSTKRHQVIVFHPDKQENEAEAAFETLWTDQMRIHIKCYADILLRWNLLDKRLELLKSVKYWDETASSEHVLDIVHTCVRCHQELQRKADVCSRCSRPSVPSCVICRLPVKGLSQACMKCQHVSHVMCWKKLGVPICPSGCGCICSVLNPSSVAFHVQNSPRTAFAEFSDVH